MAENGDEKGIGAWAKVPVWDGAPTTWRSFKREMPWWVSSLDLESTKRYNLAARWLLRQSGIVRQRGEEFAPSELAYKPATKGVDRQTGDEIVLEPEDCLYGLNKLLASLEEINGMTALDKKGELRSQFYLGTQRKAGERVSEFCTRFRTVVADLKSEGVNLPSELGWFLKDKMGLDPLRKQLLDTALQGAEDYNIIESEILRLFKELHISDPLYRKMDRPKLTVRRMFQHAQHPASSSSSSTASTLSRSPSMFSAKSFGRNSSVSSGSTRKVMLTEVPEEGHDDEPELVPDDENHGHEADVTETPGLEELLQSEAECFAAELQEAEEMGVGTDTLEGLEQNFESAAEALVTMKEARTRLQEIRKDRGYGKTDNKGGSKGAASQTASRKSSGKFPCFDCNMHGHWAGDKECTMPGAGLGRKGATSVRPKAKQVRLAEALTVNADGSTTSTPISTTPSVDGILKPHETSVVHRLSTPLHEALIQNNQRDSDASTVQVLSEDKFHVGALDSACNRTCCGPIWMDSYVAALSKNAPTSITALVSSVEETERFKFGNGGLVTSSKRWRIPACVSGKMILIWISVVPVSSLGCLLGRDFLDAVGAVLNFANRSLECTFLGAGMQRLDQMTAGHFMVPLLPIRWPRPDSGGWRKCGLDNIIELKIDPTQWLKRRLSEGVSGHPSEDSMSHEHNMTESSLFASEVFRDCHDANSIEHVAMAQKMTSQQRQSPGQHPLRVPAVQADGIVAEDSGRASSILASGGKSSIFRCCGMAPLDDAEQRGPADFVERLPDGNGTLPLEAFHFASAWTPKVVRRKFGFVAGLTILLALLALPLSICFDSAGMDFAGRDDGCPTSSPRLPSWRSPEAPTLYGQEFDRAPAFPRQDWMEDVIRRGLTPFRLLAHSNHEVTEDEAEGGCHQGDERPSRSRIAVGGSRAVGSPADWTPRWTSNPQRRFDSSCPPTASHRGEQRHGGQTAAEGQTDRAVAHGQEDIKFDCNRTQFSSGSESQDSTCKTCSSREPVYSIFMVQHERHRGSSDGGEDESHAPRAGSQVSGHAEPGDGPCDERWTSSQRRLERRPDRRGHVNHSDDVDSTDELDVGINASQKVKPGIKQMITQAWEKHRKQQLAVSLDRHRLRQLLMTDFDKEMQGYMKEAFTMELDLSPFVTEVYTDTEPIARAAQRRGLCAGGSLTLGTGWDFLEARHRKAALDLVSRTKPYALIIAFPCGVWSLLQNLNPGVDLQARRAQAEALVIFALDLAKLQLRSGRHFLIENPATSAAWNLDEVVEFRERPDVLEVVVDMCRFGLRGADGGLHRKATRLLTSSQALVSELIGKRCTGDHAHSWVLGGSKVTAPAGHYTEDFSDAVVNGFMAQYDFEQAPAETYVLENVQVSEAFAAESSAAELEEADVGMESDGSVEDTKPNPDITIPAAVRQAVHQLHINTGHRSRLRLARALLIAGAPASAIEAAKQLKCSVCAERKPPKPRLPASLPPPREVGQQVHIDLVILEDSLQQRYVVAHCTDNVSRFQAARVLADKSSAAVIQFLKVHWIPLLGIPHTICADQGREFVSATFGEWCDSKSIYLYHIGVVAPWQNGIAERSGGSLKALTGAICQTHAVTNADEMQEAVGEAIAAYNSDINEAGVSPLQLVTGRIPRPGGDVLNNFAGRLAEHSLIESDTNMAKQIAIRETARVAMIRLH